jgi:hypothetical protein
MGICPSSQPEVAGARLHGTRNKPRKKAIATDERGLTPIKTSSSFFFSYLRLSVFIGGQLSFLAFFSSLLV